MDSIKKKLNFNREEALTKSITNRFEIYLRDFRRIKRKYSHGARFLGERWRPRAEARGR